LNDVIDRWYRGLVMDYHPDRGGSKEAMQAVNDAHDRLRKLVEVA
jgi:curved DNA-binding protein CbpA